MHHAPMIQAAPFQTKSASQRVAPWVGAAGQLPCHTLTRPHPLGTPTPMRQQRHRPPSNALGARAQSAVDGLFAIHQASRALFTLRIRGMHATKTGLRNAAHRAREHEVGPPECGAHCVGGAPLMSTCVRARRRRRPHTHERCISQLGQGELQYRPRVARGGARAWVICDGR